MSLYLLNISVDAVDPEASYIPEDLSYNEQESVVEIIIEKVLGYDNAIKEFDDKDSDEQNQKTTISLDLFCAKNESFVSHNLCIIQPLNNFKRYSTKLSLGYNKVDTPPPIS
ncbi:hypothetical protein QYS48_17985 [Marivirga arenosa]|uniref:Uncharacterized protein n=1 Tax=Marivirga arenosa TaxID=3059076 RepID=A0AA49GG12_9BACT|nr:hypothetical protein [Marivirga sp. ABR2-2]WKK84097.2 hypothetical protein QYS48_17985 [Marivirga sp. ABR2-2]